MLTLDEKLFLWINGLAGNIAPLDWFIQRIANDYVIIVSACFILLLLWFSTRNAALRERNQKAVACAAASLGISQLVVLGINSLFFRTRPFFELDTNLIFYQPTDSSFPSNSTTIVFAVAVAIYIYNKKAGTVLLIMASLLAFSRVFVGIHYPSDVLAGAVIGAAVAFIMYCLFTLLEPWPSRVLGLMRKIYLA
jgi:undecaprenyl-diphosphatase